MLLEAGRTQLAADKLFVCFCNVCGLKKSIHRKFALILSNKKVFCLTFCLCFFYIAFLRTQQSIFFSSSFFFSNTCFKPTNLTWSYICNECTFFKMITLCLFLSGSPHWSSNTAAKNHVKKTFSCGFNIVYCIQIPTHRHSWPCAGVQIASTYRQWLIKMSVLGVWWFLHLLTHLLWTSQNSVTEKKIPLKIMQKTLYGELHILSWPVCQESRSVKSSEVLLKCVCHC